MTFVVATFIGVLALVLGAYWLFIVQPEASARRALQKRLRPHEEAARKSKLTLAKTDQPTPGGALFKGIQSLIDHGILAHDRGLVIRTSLLMLGVSALSVFVAVAVGVGVGVGISVGTAVGAVVSVGVAVGVAVEVAVGASVGV